MGHGLLSSDFKDSYSLSVITHPDRKMFLTTNEWFSYYLPMSPSEEKMYAYLFWANHHKFMTKKILQQEVRVCSTVFQKRWRAGERVRDRIKLIKEEKGVAAFHCYIVYAKKNYLACKILVSSDIIVPLTMWWFIKFTFHSVLRFVIDHV